MIKHIRFNFQLRIDHLLSIFNIHETDIDLFGLANPQPEYLISSGLTNLKEVKVLIYIYIGTLRGRGA
jgi:hypothetical protein